MQSPRRGCRGSKAPPRHRCTMCAGAIAGSLGTAGIRNTRSAHDDRR
ncbi:hypothetical protein XCR_2139 [Xanthomonas campestris pv. raphani 756C]|nr:hypothetical protein XCR_2139 [Xanthomonas campestris pv. raphani 756C]